MAGFELAPLQLLSRGVEDGEPTFTRGSVTGIACGGVSGGASGRVVDDAVCRDRRRSASWTAYGLKKQKLHV